MKIQKEKKSQHKIKILLILKKNTTNVPAVKLETNNLFEKCANFQH